MSERFSDAITPPPLRASREAVHVAFYASCSLRTPRTPSSFDLERDQVISTLGMTRDELAEMRETFDAELLALSRLDTPQVVKVHVAQL